MSDNENSAPEASAEDTAAGFGAPKLLNAREAGTDEFSKAVALKPQAPPAPVEAAPKGKYCIDYEYNNEQIHETHAALRGAVARVADLKRLGIVPATSVAG